MNHTIPDASTVLAQAGFHGLLGYEPGEWRKGYVELYLPIKPHHLNLGGVIHGGVLATMLDMVCAQAGTYCPIPGRIRKAITLSLTSTFTGQASDGVIRAVGKVRASGNRIYNSSGEVFSQNGTLLAFGEATCRFRSGSESETGVPIIPPV